VSVDIEDLLATALRRRANEVDWQPELLDGTLQRRHKRLIRRRAGLAVGAVSLAVTVLAVSVSAVVSGGGVRSATPKIQTDAYVVSRTRSAVEAARTDVLKVDTQVADGWSYASWVDSATGDSRIDVYPPGAGAPVFYYVSRSSAVIVNYQTKTYSTASVIVHGRRQIPLMTRIVLFPVSLTWGGLGARIPSAAAIRRELANGSFRLAGTETVGGQRLLHLRGSGVLPQFRPLNHPDWGYQTIDMWINARTYLPVSSASGAGPYAPRMHSTFTWLPATPQNLAVFTPEIPPGFGPVPPLTRVPLNRLPTGRRTAKP
jgi:hypothetical protein